MRRPPHEVRIRRSRLLHECLFVCFFFVLVVFSLGDCFSAPLAAHGHALVSGGSAVEELHLGDLGEGDVVEVGVPVGSEVHGAIDGDEQLLDEVASDPEAVVGVGDAVLAGECRGVAVGFAHEATEHRTVILAADTGLN